MLNGIVNTILYLHQSIEEKNFIGNKLKKVKILKELYKVKEVNIIITKVHVNHVHTFV